LAIPELERRLESLDPSHPEEYYLLGEEVASEASSPEHAALATRLYVLAFELDRVNGDGELGAPIALALADLSRLDRERRWLRSLAMLLDPRYSDWELRGEHAHAGLADSSGLAAAEALGLARAGHGHDAARVLDEPGVRALIERFETMLSPSGMPGGSQLIEKYTHEWPCPICKNQRITLIGEGARRDHRLCPNCSGNPGPDLDAEQVIAHLRFESRLLNGIQRSWSAQIAADRGAPLRDPNPEELAASFGVDPKRSVYRSGRWTEPAESAPAAEGSPTTSGPNTGPV